MVRKNQKGFSLIEVMIALFVLSVGMLGSSAMVLQAKQVALRTNYDATAAQLAQSMAEMMRSNVSGINGGNYNNLSSHAASPGCITTGCNAADRVAYDSFIWGWMMDEYLPGSSGTVSGNGLDSVFTITVTWNQTERTGKDTGAIVTRNYTMIFQP